MGIGLFTITNKSGTPLSAGFYPGQVIEGLVNLTVTDEHMKCKGIRLEITGKGRVAWSETTGAQMKLNLSLENHFNFGFEIPKSEKRI